MDSGTTCWLHYLCKQDAESEDGNIGIVVPLTLSMSQGWNDDITFQLRCSCNGMLEMMKGVLIRLL